MKCRQRTKDFSNDGMECWGFHDNHHHLGTKTDYEKNCANVDSQSNHGKSKAGRWQICQDWQTLVVTHWLQSHRTYRPRHTILAMVFHFMRADDFDKKDIVSMRDIVDLSTKRPSWVKLLEILKADDDFGVAFQKVNRC